MQRATGVQLHYVVDHPKVGEQLIQKKLPICNTFKDKRHLFILSRYVTQQRAIDVQLHYVVDHPKGE